jgi:NitT/TauT family transport system substrate-binding protein
MIRTYRERLLAVLAIVVMVGSVAACSAAATSPAAVASGSISGSAAPVQATGCQVANPAVPLDFQLNFTAGGYNAGFALALQKGYYSEVGLNVTIIKGQGSGTTAQLVASGQAGLAYADAVAVMQLIAKGAKLKILSTMYQSSSSAINALASSGITSIKDLKGKSLGVPTGESASALLPILVAANGMTVKDINIVSMPGESLVSTISQHQVDAIVGDTDGYGIILHDNGQQIVSLPFADFGVPTVSTSIFASESFLAANGNSVRCFIQASLRGWDYAIKNRDEAVQALVTTFPYDTHAALNREQLDAAIALFCKNGAKFVGKAEPQAWETTVSTAEKALGLPGGTPATSYYTYDYLPTTLPTTCPIA